MIRNSSKIIHPRYCKTTSLTDEYTLTIINNDTYNITVSSNRNAYYSLKIYEEQEVSIIAVLGLLFIIAGSAILVYPDALRKLAEKFKWRKIGELSLLTKLFLYISAIINLIAGFITISGLFV